MSIALTTRQQQILDWIAECMQRQGAPPTRVEISAHFGFRSPNAAESHLRALARKGVITLDSGRARGIRLSESRTADMRLPLVGQVAAGSPILAEENVEEELSMEGQSFSPAAHYLLRVRGDSMIDAGILNGDLLAVHRTPEARQGQIVVARLGEEVTVKRFHRRGRKVQLRAANPEYQPIEVDLDHQELVIEGLGVGVLRRW